MNESSYAPGLDNIEIAQGLVAGASGSAPVRLVMSKPAPVRENELVFFFKPEVFFPGVDTAKIVEFSLDFLGRYGIEISACVVISGPELERLSIMDAHYGYINTLSRRTSSELDDAQLSAIRDSVGALASTPVFGGHEILARFSNLTVASLDAMWATKRSIKLRSGLYVQQYDIDGSPVVIVNGFHPAQLDHFTAADRKIALLILHTDLAWRFLRVRLLGDTFPERALPGTLRGTYYERSAEYGLPKVSIANNCVHLSAGPFEAGFELRNFFGQIETTGYDVTKTTLGRHLSVSDLGFALSNPVTSLNSKEVSLFDATEEFDTTGAIEVLNRVYRRG